MAASVDLARRPPRAAVIDRSPIDEPAGLRTASLAQQAYDRVRALILERKLDAGRALLEVQLADRLGISRTPTREALVRLAGEGLLVRRDARSWAVRELSTREFFDCMRARELVEGEAAALAAGRCDPTTLSALAADVRRFKKGEHAEIEHWNHDDRLHQFIAESSGNVLFPGIIARLRADARLFRLNSPLHRQRENHDEHGAIIVALRAGDAKAARTTMRAHLRSLLGDVRRAVIG